MKMTDSVKAVGFFERRGFTLYRLPLGGSEASDTVVNDTTVWCQSRGVTEPAGETACQR